MKVKVKVKTKWSVDFGYEKIFAYLESGIRAIKWTRVKQLFNGVWETVSLWCQDLYYYDFYYYDILNNSNSWTYISLRLRPCFNHKLKRICKCEVCLITFYIYSTIFFSTSFPAETEQTKNKMKTLVMHRTYPSFLCQEHFTEITIAEWATPFHLVS